MTSFSSRMLHFSGTTFPMEENSLAAVSKRSKLREAITTSHPFSNICVSTSDNFTVKNFHNCLPSVSSSLVMAFPIPVPPPVTRATFPAKRPGLNIDIVLKDMNYLMLGYSITRSGRPRTQEHFMNLIFRTSLYTYSLKLAALNHVPKRYVSANLNRLNFSFTLLT